MRDVYKNPMFYYLLAPIAAGVWPLLVWGVYLPKAHKAWVEEQALYVEGQTHILDILRLDPDRLEIGGDSEVAGEFAYSKAIGRVANLCGIAFPNNCTYTAGSIRSDRGKRSQNARVTLTDTDIVRAASFLSTIQRMFVKLKCDKIELTNRKNAPDRWEDRWDVEFNFWYYY